MGVTNKSINGDVEGCRRSISGVYTDDKRIINGLLQKGHREIIEGLCIDT